MLPEVFGLDLESPRQPLNRRRVWPWPLAGLDRGDRRSSDTGDLGELDLGQAPTLPILFKVRQRHKRIIPDIACTLL